MRIPNPIKRRTGVNRAEDLVERREEQAKLKQTLADKHETDIRIARLEGAVRVLTSRAGKVGS